MTSKLSKLSYKDFKTLFNRLVPFDSLVSDIPVNNVLCPFHNDRNKPSAKYYIDEDGTITLYCYAEQRRYTAIDYVQKVMGVSPDKYISNMLCPNEIEILIDYAEKTGVFQTTPFQEQLMKIDNYWIDSMEDPVEFLNKVYKGYYLQDVAKKEYIKK